MIGAYQSVPHFAYPGWRLRIPGGPAGGHYKGFTHNYSVGTRLAAQDQYEAERDAGMASHDAASAYPRAPRGVYRGPSEVPPAPNAGTRAYRTYRGYQTERHPGTSESPGSFPAPFVEQALEPLLASIGLGAFSAGEAMQVEDFCSNMEFAAPPPGCNWKPRPAPTCAELVCTDTELFPGDGKIQTDGSGATNVVNTLQPAVVPPISPRPSPVVRAPGGFIPAWQITVGPGGKVTGRIGTAGSSFADWMEQDSIWAGVANKWVALGVLGVFMFSRRRG